MSAVPFKANADRRHHIPKQQDRVTNWSEYDAALRQRGSLTVWFTEEAIAAWRAEPRTTRRLRVGRIEPERRERNVDSPDQLILRPRHAGDRGSPRNEARRGRGQEVAARQGEPIALRSRRGTTVMGGIH